MPTLFEYAGGEAALHRLEEIFLASVLRDPLLQPLFGAGQPHHVVHLTAFTADSFGGPDRFTRELGFANRIAGGGHAGRSGVSRRGREHVEFGSRGAIQNSHAATDEQLHPLRQVPLETWAGDDGDSHREVTLLIDREQRGSLPKLGGGTWSDHDDTLRCPVGPAR